MAIETYIHGAWNVTCDRCGLKKKNFECTLQMNKEDNNVFVCTDKCLDVHNPQQDLTGIPDKQSVPIPRPGDGYTTYANAVAPLTAILTGNLLGPNQPNS